jgi:hypothetical protein
LLEGRRRPPLLDEPPLAHYLRHTWLDGLYPGRPHDPLFSPDMFFDGGGAAWYRKARGLQ